LALGIAAAYGEIEGGAEAAIEAASLALAAAGPGEVQVSFALRPRPRVLVVDDDESFSRALADTLYERGWEAHPCADAAEGLARVREPTYNALFVDLVMPGHTGVDVLREALRYSPRRPAILMSGHDAQHAAILDALALGPVMFVRKPIGAADLDAALRMFSLLLPGLLTPRERI
jgi:CheY-like chemotaxis protein